MTRPRVLVLAWLPDGAFEQLVRRHPECEWLDGRAPEAFERHFAGATIAYGLPPAARLGEAPGLRWIQLVSAGVPQELCAVAQDRGLVVTNLAGLYGNSIAEHALGLLTVLARRFHLAIRNQEKGAWDRKIGEGLSDLHGRTLGIVGLGDIGRAVARLGRAYGMRVVGCRRQNLPTPEVDRLYPLSELRAMLGEADCVVVAAPQTAHTEGMLGPAEFGAMKRGAVYVNVSRGGIAQEPALLEALRSGHVAAAGLDVFATEPLPTGHPLWSMRQVVVVPHVAGEAINQSGRPAERFSRNLAAWELGRPLEGRVDCAWGY